jgi:hypothetical protein
MKNSLLAVSFLFLSFGCRAQATEQGASESAASNSAKSGYKEGVNYQFIRCTASADSEYITLNANLRMSGSDGELAIVNLPSIHHEPNLRLHAFPDSASYYLNALTIPVEGVMIPVAGEDNGPGVQEIQLVQIEGIDMGTSAPQSGLKVYLALTTDKNRDDSHAYENCTITNKAMLFDYIGNLR